MENKNFDDIIKSKLQELEDMPATSDWDVFEEMYDEELAGSEAAFDRSIADKVENYNIAFNSSHWALMKEKLEREEFIRTSIYFSKIAEAGIVFLLLFTFLNLFPSLNYQQVKRSFASIEKSVNPAVKTLAPTLSSSDDETTFKTSQLNRAERIQAIVTNDKRSFVDIKTIETKNPEALSIVHTIEKSNSAASNKSILEIPDIVSEFSELENEKMEFYRVPSKNVGSRSKGESYLSASFSPTVNIVNSPANYILHTDPYTVDALGFETGLGYSFRMNKFEIGTGITYAKKSYQPQILNQLSGGFTEGYSERTLQNISFDLISVPFSLSYHMLSGDDFSLYASAGTSFNFITNAGYRVNQNGQIIESLDRIQETRRAAEREYTQGIFQGGSIHDNLFISLDISIGLETKLLDNLNIFFAPTLRQHIGIAGIGPNQDHVHSFGLNIGLKKKM